VSLRDISSRRLLYVDDFWARWHGSMGVPRSARVLPPHKYPIIDIPRDHPILHTSTT
jgi:hypothetical protein